VAGNYDQRLRIFLHVALLPHPAGQVKLAEPAPASSDFMTSIRASCEGRRIVAAYGRLSVLRAAANDSGKDGKPAV
jgi:hypothetical protein